MKITHLCALALTAYLFVSHLHADQFGTAGNTFMIDFVTVGNPGNGNDVGAGGGLILRLMAGCRMSFRWG